MTGVILPITINHFYVVEDELFDKVKNEVFSGLTKNKGLQNIIENEQKIKEAKHDESCLICGKLKPEKASLVNIIVNKANSIQNFLLNEMFFKSPSNLAIASAYVAKYNRELLKTTCQIMGCKLLHSHLISEDIFQEIERQATLLVHLFGLSSSKIITFKKSIFQSILKYFLEKYEYNRPQSLTDFFNATKLVGKLTLERKMCLIVLLGGSSGTGKSTLASLLASRLGISTVLSTDSIRHIMRNFLTREENQILFASTYEAKGFINEKNDPNISEKKKTIIGYLKQCEYVYPSLLSVIDSIINKGESIVIEGVHLTIKFMKQVMEKYPFCVPFVITIKNEDKHKERFAVRAKQMTLDPKFNKYIENFSNIRHIHKYMCKKSEASLIPKLDNCNVDKSVGLIHSTLVRCLRKIINNEPLYDIESKKATHLISEFNVVSKNKLSSSEAQKIINSKASKSEIFLRFLKDLQQNQSKINEQSIIIEEFNLHKKSQSIDLNNNNIQPIEPEEDKDKVKKEVKEIEKTEHFKSPNNLNEENKENSAKKMLKSSSSFKDLHKSKDKRSVTFAPATFIINEKEKVEEDKNSQYSGSGFCSLVSGSVEVKTHYKYETDENISDKIVESGESDIEEEERKDEQEDEDEKDINTIKATQSKCPNLGFLKIRIQKNLRIQKRIKN